MNKTQHTEIPYEVYNPPDYEFQNQTIHICLIVKKNKVIAELRDREHGLANAQFIVKACNSYQAMYEALKKIWTTAGIKEDNSYLLSVIRTITFDAIAQVEKDGE